MARGEPLARQANRTLWLMKTIRRITSISCAFAATRTSGPPKVLREQEFEGSDRLRSPSDLIGPVRRNPWALEIRFAPDAASNVLNFLNLLFTSWIFDS